MTCRRGHTERYPSGGCVECVRARARARQAQIRRELYGYGCAEPTAEQSVRGRWSGSCMSDQTRLAAERRAWLDHLADVGFPLTEYHGRDTPRERWEELAKWHERLRRAWNDLPQKG